MLNTASSLIVKTIRSSGQALDAFGRRFEVNPYIDKLVPSTRIVKFGKHVPDVQGCFVASSASIIGRVTVGANSSVWYGAVLRADVSTVTVGSNVFLGDRVMVHCNGEPKNAPAVIGDGVLVQAGAIIHGATLESGSVVCAGAQVLDGAVVQSGAVVGAGAVVGIGKTVPAGQLWAGVPAKYVREVTPEEAAAYRREVAAAVELAVVHAKESAKDWQTIEQEEFDYEQMSTRNEGYYRRLTPEELSARLGEVENQLVPGRVLDSPVSPRTHADSRP